MQLGNPRSAERNGKLYLNISLINVDFQHFKKWKIMASIKVKHSGSKTIPSDFRVGTAPKEIIKIDKNKNYRFGV